MDSQLPLQMTVAPSHVYVSAHYDWRAGWSLRLTWAATGQPGQPSTDYEALSASELVDVVAAELERTLTPRRPSATDAVDGAGWR